MSANKGRPEDSCSSQVGVLAQMGVIERLSYRLGQRKVFIGLDRKLVLAMMSRTLIDEVPACDATQDTFRTMQLVRGSYGARRHISASQLRLVAGISHMIE